MTPQIFVENHKKIEYDTLKLTIKKQIKIMYTEDINKAYVSEIDKFLHEFDKKNPKSNSQHKEIRKHSRIAQLRDGHTRNGLQQLTDRV